MSAPHPALREPTPLRRPVGDLGWWCRVTQLLERLNRVVEEGNLFDPARPSLGSELEALRQHLETLRSGPDAWESLPDRPAGAHRARGGLGRACAAGRGWRLLRPELWCQLGSNPGSVTSDRGLAAGPPSEPSLRVPGADVLGWSRPS